MAAAAVVAPASFSSFISWFQAAGPEVQAALIGNAGITLAALLTVVLTAVFATRQFRHERQEKAKDRAVSVKNDLLFESVKGASRGLAAFATLTDLEKPTAEVARDFQSGVLTLTTAGAVAAIETVSQARDFLNAIGPAFMKCAVARRPLDALHAEIGRIQANIDAQVADNQAVSHMQRDALAGGSTEARAPVINKMFQAGHSLFQEFARERQEATARLASAHRQYILETMTAHSRVAPLLNEYIASVRKDIGIDGRSRAQYLEASHIDPKKPLQMLGEALAD